MKRILTLLVFASIVISMQAQKQISYINDDGSWYQVYDTQGKKITTVSKQTVGEVVGWSADFFVSKDGSWYKIYDASGKLKKTLSKSTVGKVVSVSGDTFTSKDGGWIKIYDKTGKLLSTRSAH
jgi:regulatory protein YycH of two-component signal transduction system YycFG